SSAAKPGRCARAAAKATAHRTTQHHASEARKPALWQVGQLGSPTRVANLPGQIRGRPQRDARVFILVIEDLVRQVRAVQLLSRTAQIARGLRQTLGEHSGE